MKFKKIIASAVKKTLNSKKIKILNTGVLLVLTLLLLEGCSGIFYFPGASYGYFIWEKNNSIFVDWSTDRKPAKFSGTILTDGEITGYKLQGWEEENDVIKAVENKIEFIASLSDEDYSDGFSFSLQNYTYIEFDLKINNGYDLSRINLGGFLENPSDNVFRIEKDYFKQLKTKPFYQKRPFAEFFNKLFSNKYFTIIYIFVLGIIVIEILRVTFISRRKRKIIWIAGSYVILILLEICIYFILKFLAR